MFQMQKYIFFGHGNDSEPWEFCVVQAIKSKWVV